MPDDDPHEGPGPRAATPVEHPDGTISTIDPVTRTVTIQNPDAGTVTTIEPITHTTGAERDAYLSTERKRQVDFVGIQTKKRASFLNKLLEDFDQLIYAQFILMYYLDTSFIRLAIRTIVQFTLLSPTTAPRLEGGGSKPFVHGIFMSNLIPILCHLSFSLPTTSTGSRGYLHGGIFVDFIGQRAPTTKVCLVLLDLLIALFQCVMLAVHVEEDRCHKAILNKATMAAYMRGERDPGAATRPTAQSGTRQSQELDAAERGEVGQPPADVPRQGAGEGDEADEADEADDTTERDPLTSHHTDEAGPSSAHQNIMASTAQSIKDGEGPLDVYYSGNVSLGEFHMVNTIKELWSKYIAGQDNSLTATSYRLSYQATMAGRAIGRGAATA